MKNQEENNVTKTDTDMKLIQTVHENLSIWDRLIMLKQKFDTGIHKIDQTYDLSIEALNNWDAEEKRKIKEELDEIKERHSPDVIDASWEEKKTDMMKNLEERRKKILLDKQKLEDEINRLRQEAEQLLKGNKK